MENVMTDTPPYVRPDVALFLQFLNAVPGPKFWQVPADDARAMTTAMRDVADAPVGELAVMRDISIPGPAGAIPARLYDRREERDDRYPPLCPSRRGIVSAISERGTGP